MTKKKPVKRGKPDVKPTDSGGALPAVPPPDDPLARSRAEGDVDSAEAAARRVEAILRTRRMPSDDEPPDKK